MKLLEVSLIKSFNSLSLLIFNTLCKCLNIGVNAAHSDLLARIDADDPAHPQRLEIQYKAIQPNFRIGILGTG